MRRTASRIIIFDTSVFIDHLRTNKYTNHFQNINALIRNSSVVLSELARGATKEIELDFVVTLSKNHPILTPTEKTGWNQGRYYQGFIKTEDFLQTSGGIYILMF